MIRMPTSRQATPGRVLRPRAQIFSQTRLVAAALTLPIFTAMLWFSIPRGTWPRVIVAFLFVLALYGIGAALLRGVSIRLEPGGVIERGFFVRENRIPAKRIASAVVLDVYRGASSETVRQLFLFDSGDRLLLRMRGEFWSNEAIEAVATAFEVPVRRPAEPLTARQLREGMSTEVYWFERWPWIGVLSVAGAIAALALLLIVLMSPDSLVLR